MLVYHCSFGSVPALGPAHGFVAGAPFCLKMDLVPFFLRLLDELCFHAGGVVYREPSLIIIQQEDHN